MTNQLVKIAGIFALSAVTVAGMSLAASDARAADEEEEDIAALDSDNSEVDADEGTTAESEEAIRRGYRGWRGYGYRGGYYGGRGYYAPPPFYYRPYRRFYGGYYPYGYYRGYRPIPTPYYYRGPVCGPYGCIW
jgi:hypothetical protein